MERLAEYLGVTVSRARAVLPAYTTSARRTVGDEFGGGCFSEESELVKLGRELESSRLDYSPDLKQ
jgi:hypothetical protein